MNNMSKVVWENLKFGKEQGFKKKKNDVLLLITYPISSQFTHSFIHSLSI